MILYSGFGKIKNEERINKSDLESLRSRGFTLIETLLYASIISVLILSFSVFFSIILQSRIKHQTMSQLDQEGIQAVQIVSQTIRNSKIINLPAQGATGATLSLDIFDNVKNPVVVNSSAGNIQIKEGTGAVIPLTSSEILVSNLLFSNVSRNDTPGIIKFQFTLTHINPSLRNEYDYEKTFYGSASLR